MPLSVYEKICDILMKGDSDEYLFAHAFLTIEWNLMARADNVVHLSVEHVEWNADSLIFYFATTKTDQSGEKQRLPWHVYSNPLHPHICPVLSFAKYVLAHPGVLENNGRNMLFPGSNQYSRFLKIFHNVLVENKDALLELGVDPTDLGSHSTRKDKCLTNVCMYFFYICVTKLLFRECNTCSFRLCCFSTNDCNMFKSRMEYGVC